MGDLKRAFQKGVNEEIATLEQQVGAGQCSNFDIYRYHVGLIEGLKMAQTVFDAEYKLKFEED